MKKIFFSIFFIAFFSLVSAGTPDNPDVNLFLGSNNITVVGQTIRINASTSFDAPPIGGIVCILGSNCRLVIEDCNGSIYACETNTENFPLNIVGDWNGISLAPNFENDLNCSNSCRRDGPVEDTLAAFNITTRSRGSRWVRACWINDTTVFKKCSPIQRIHTYETPASCAPPGVGNFIISGRTCPFKHPDNNFTAIPLVVFVDKNLIVANGGIIQIIGASIDFNARSGISPLAHRFQISSNLNNFNSIFQTGLGYFDTNLPIFDRNQIRIFGYSNN